MSQQAKDIQGKRYDPVGECIYCGSDGGVDGLRSEHVVPFSLGGDAELPDASCRKCEGVTSYLDGYLARAIYYHLRVHTGTQSRTGHPDVLPVEIELKEGSKTLYLPTADHPFFLNMPVWGYPSVLRGHQPTSDFGDARAHVYWSMPPTVLRTLGLRDGEAAIVKDTSRPINLPTFARAIAKIGYCHAVAHYGLRGFRRLVMPDLILGKYPCIPYFVGGDRTLPPPPTPRGQLHEFQFINIGYQSLRLLTVAFRIFAHSGTAEHGMPIYRVVFGAPPLTRTPKETPPKPPTGDCLFSAPAVLHLSYDKAPR